MAEIALHVLHGQRLSGSIDHMEMVEQEVKAWCEARNNMNAKIHWQFTIQDARTKLK